MKTWYRIINDTSYRRCLLLVFGVLIGYGLIFWIPVFLTLIQTGSIFWHPSRGIVL